MKTATFAINLIRIARGLFFVGMLWSIGFSIASAEKITAFDSEIIVQPDSSLLVTETITYDFGGDYRHGIFRNVSARHAQSASVWYKQRYIELEPISVTRDGSSEPYTLEKYAGLSLKIGRANETITGVHIYEVKYRAKGALSELPEGTELYWNVTGGDWPVTILQTTARIISQPPVKLGDKSDCYVGIAGSVQKCDSVSLNNQSSIFKQASLYEGQQLTVARNLSLPQSPLVLERFNSLLLWLISLALGLAVLIISIYRWRTKYRISRSVVAQYEPYLDFKPMFTGVLFDSRLDSRDISAGIVYLAQQGFISIKQVTDKVFFLIEFEYTDYEVTLKRQITEAETYFHEQLLHLLFGVSGVQGEVIKLSKIKKDRSKLRENFRTVQKLRKAVIKDLVKTEFLEQYVYRGAGGAVAIFLIFLMFSFSQLFSFMSEYVVLQILFVLVGFGAIYILFTAERRTIKGHEALNYLKGFKLFLKVIEAERYKFHNAPALSPQQFMEYLPYAIAFGVEKEWAKVFQNIQITDPDWYSSASGGHFNSNAFTTNISAFSTSFSSSTGSSGSSGGGSSGGGSGGGGGGSW